MDQLTDTQMLQNAWTEEDVSLFFLKKKYEMESLLKRSSSKKVLFLEYWKDELIQGKF